MLLKEKEISVACQPTYRELIILMASKAFSMLTIGKMGPKISSCITGSVTFTSIRTVGSMYFSAESVRPPMATVAPFKRFATRLVGVFR